MNFKIKYEEDGIMEKFKADRNGVFNKHPEFLSEMKEVQKLYEYYDGFRLGNKNENYGQMWKTPENMDYEPTKEIRNIIQKLIYKQSRFMFGKSPKIIVKPFNGERDKDNAESKRAMIDYLFDVNNFWSNCGKAFIDATIGKRVLLVVEANEGMDIKFKFYTMPEFMYQLDPNDPEKLKEVQIVYQDERTKGKPCAEQIWHWHTYKMAPKNLEQEETSETELTCWLEKKMTNGDEQVLYSTSQGLKTEQQIVEIEDMDGIEKGVLLEQVEMYDTGFSQIPCFVILNEGLTGDTKGTSDIKPLTVIQDNFNKTISDFRDSLRFRMFEQPVVIDGSTESVKNLKIAPNAMIDLKTDTSLSIGSSGTAPQAKISNLSGGYTFTEPAKYYLDGAKREMYELMDQPLPEKIQEAPSGKAMQMLFYDLQSRCNRKWQDWAPAIKWLIRFLEEAFSKVSNLQPSLESEELKNSMVTLTSIEIIPEYPIPADEDDKRKLSISEVESKVKSRKTHIREFGMVEDEEAEWNEIVEEQAQLDEQSASVFIPEPTETGEG